MLFEAASGNPRGKGTFNLCPCSFVARTEICRVIALSGCYRNSAKLEGDTACFGDTTNDFMDFR